MFLLRVSRLSEVATDLHRAGLIRAALHAGTLNVCMYIHQFASTSCLFVFYYPCVHYLRVIRGKQLNRCVFLLQHFSSPSLLCPYDPLSEHPTQFNSSPELLKATERRNIRSIHRSSVIISGRLWEFGRENEGSDGSACRHSGCDLESERMKSRDRRGGDGEMTGREERMERERGRDRGEAG